MTSNTKKAAVLATVFAVGLAAGAALAKKGVLAADLFVGKPKAEAASMLLGAAKELAGKGSWENIAVGRVYYLGGRQKDGQEIFDRITNSPKVAASDWIRIGRVYYEAGEWDKAKAAFDKVLQLKPDDEDWLSEIGAYYNLKGDRAKAEEYFTKSFTRDSGNLYNSLRVAGSYLGVKPLY
ncbi:MAG: tetratricopeptide repeat protein [Acidobacteriota bacterium]